jgi:hypothetical protein
MAIFRFCAFVFFRRTSICLLQVPDLVRSVKHGQSTRGSCIHASFWDKIQLCSEPLLHGCYFFVHTNAALVACEIICLSTNAAFN